MLSNPIRFAVPFGFFVWSLFYPALAGYVFVGLAALCLCNVSSVILELGLAAEWSLQASSDAAA